MNKSEKQPGDPITPQMTLLEIMYEWRASESIFSAYEAQAGVCLRCHALFDTLAEAAATYNLNLTNLLADLNALARSLDSAQDKPS